MRPDRAAALILVSPRTLFSSLSPEFARVEAPIRAILKGGRHELSTMVAHLPYSRPRSAVFRCSSGCAAGRRSCREGAESRRPQAVNRTESDRAQILFLDRNHPDQFEG